MCVLLRSLNQFLTVIHKVLGATLGKEIINAQLFEEIMHQCPEVKNLQVRSLLLSITALCRCPS